MVFTGHKKNVPWELFCYCFVSLYLKTMYLNAFGIKGLLIAHSVSFDHFWRAKLEICPLCCTMILMIKEK